MTNERINYEEQMTSDKVERAETIRSIFVKSDGKPVVLSAHNKLSAITAFEDTPPMYETSEWSRFVFYIIKDGKQVIANIPAVDVAYLFDQTRKADWIASMSGDEEDLPECYKVTLFSRDFKGKTPAEVLLENPANEKALRDQYAFLEKNVARYPSNAAQMNGIAQAITLMQQGKLEKKKARTSVIYCKDIKFLSSKTDAQGRVLVYSVKITYTAGQDSPVTIEIGNSYAPLKTSSANTTVPDMKQAVGSVLHEIHCPYEEWFQMASTMHSQVENFKTCMFAKNFEKTQELVNRRFTAKSAS